MLIPDADTEDDDLGTLMHLHLWPGSDGGAPEPGRSSDRCTYMSTVWYVLCIPGPPTTGDIASAQTWRPTSHAWSGLWVLLYYYSTVPVLARPRRNVRVEILVVVVGGGGVVGGVVVGRRAERSLTGSSGAAETGMYLRWPGAVKPVTV